MAKIPIIDPDKAESLLEPPIKPELGPPVPAAPDPLDPRKLLRYGQVHRTGVERAKHRPAQGENEREPGQDSEPNLRHGE
jgi:hypothetical protein